jgi:hypothetical protein
LITGIRTYGIINKGVINLKRMVKCPNCQGDGEYILIQNWEGKDYETPVKCECENGKISWSEFCVRYRKRNSKENKKGIMIVCGKEHDVKCQKFDYNKCCKICDDFIECYNIGCHCGNISEQNQSCNYLKETSFKEGELTMRFKGNIIITDPCYVIRDENQMTKDDWEECNYGENMEALGIKNYLISETIYGDWSCTTYNKNTGEEIGKFCADAGLVGVFLLSEVLAYNPDFDYYISKPWTTTLIKNFDGDIRIEVVKVVNEYTSVINKNDEEVRVIGEGNINFYTTQTGI